MAKAKRLTLKSDTLRELYLKSGNQCAFPGCSRLIIDPDGVVVGEICHIEAAEEGGPRFNNNQTDEDRRQFSNLMLMCHDHHVRTDDVSIFSVERMQEIKREHEAKYTDVVAKLRESIVDQTDQIAPRFPSSLNKLHEVLKWNSDATQIAWYKEDFEQFIHILSKIPIPAREVLSIILERGQSKDIHSNPSVLYTEVFHALSLPKADLEGHVAIIERYRLAWVDTEEYEAEIHLLHHRGTWPIWSALKKFSKKTGLPLRSLVVELRFDFFD